MASSFPRAFMRSIYSAYAHVAHLETTLTMKAFCAAEPTVVIRLSGQVEAPHALSPTQEDFCATSHPSIANSGSDN